MSRDLEAPGTPHTPAAASRRLQQARLKRAGEVQRQYVSARTIVNGHLLCLRPPGAPATPAPGPRDSYCRVLEISPINFQLRSEEEQEEIIAGFGAWLNAQRFPLQILVQVRRLDLMQYIRRLQATVRTRVEALDEVQAPDVLAQRWVQLAADHVSFLQSLARNTQLLERHFYIILTFEGESTALVAGESIARRLARRLVPRHAASAASSVSTTSAHAYGPRSGDLRNRQDRRMNKNLAVWQRQESAEQHLDLRVTETTRQLERLGVEVRSLAGSELATLYYRSLTPERATKHPLNEETVAGLDTPIQARLGPSPWPSPGSRESGSCESGSCESGSRESGSCESGSRESGSRESGSPAPASPLLAQVPPLPPTSLPPGQRDFASLADLLAPASVELAPDHLCLEGEYSRVLAVTSYPRRVFSGWLAQVIDEDFPLDVALHIHPRDSRAALGALRRHLAQYQASAALDQRIGRLPDPERRIALEDAARLQERIERGVTRVFDFGLYVRLYASRQGGLAELDHRTEQVHGAFDHLGVVARSARWEQDLGLAGVLPEGRDALHRTRFFDTETIATAWPFSSSGISMSDGILFGLVPANGSFVILDPFSPKFENANQVVFGVSGSGKSYATKLQVIRSLISGISSVIVDPENEYQRLCLELGGQCIRLAPGSNQHINPFDLPEPNPGTTGTTGDDPLADKVQSLHTLFDLLLADRGSGQPGTLSRTEKALLDQVILRAYQRAGVTSDRRTHARGAPLLRDVYDLLLQEPTFRADDTTGLAGRLHRYVDGALSRLFSAPTDVELDNPLVVFNVADLDEELRPLGLYLVSDCIWTHVRREELTPRPRLLLVDEAWSLLQFPEGGRFLSSLVRRARKRFLGVVTISQDINDFLGSEWGQTILKNSGTKLLMKQDASSIDLISETFKLSAGERRQLLGSEKGEGLLFALGARIAIRVEASRDEHALATTDPRELEQIYSAARPTSGTVPAIAPATDTYTAPAPPKRRKHGAYGVSREPHLDRPWIPAMPSAFAALQAINAPHAADPADVADAGQARDTLLHLPTRYWRRAAAGLVAGETQDAPDPSAIGSQPAAGLPTDEEADR